MTTSSSATGRPAWLRDEDELPHAPARTPLWCENYLAYAYSPATQTGIWTHMCHRGGPPELWDEKFLVALPGDRYLAAKAFSPGYGDGGPRTCSLSIRCQEPYRRCAISYRGAARLITGAELREAPVADGEHVPVELELECHALGPAYDFGEEKLDQSWGTGHYEQPFRCRGQLEYGGERIELDGTGLRDHSWGPRDYAQIGSTAWIHGQFPESGRTFMAVMVTGKPPRPPFRYAVVGDAQRVEPSTVSGLPILTRRDDAATGYELDLEAGGAPQRVTAEIVGSLDMAFIGPAEIALGRHRGPGVNHDYVISFTRFEWGGEVGYGVTDRTIELG
jgi:hypothetical protein